MVKKLSLKELEVMLCNVYEMDIWLPSPILKREFAETSYKLWALDEFRNYVAAHIYPQSETSIKNLELMAHEFTEKMGNFASMNQRNNSIFTIAKMVGENIQDLLYAME